MKKHRRQRRSIIPMWRLELACGHVAFGLDSEPHRKGIMRSCASCGPPDRKQRVMKAEPLHDIDGAGELPT